MHCSAPFGIRFKESVDPRIKPFCVYSKVKIAGWTTVVSGAPVARPISGQVMGGCWDENSTPYVQIATYYVCPFVAILAQVFELAPFVIYLYIHIRILSRTIAVPYIRVLLVHSAR